MFFLIDFRLYRVRFGLNQIMSYRCNKKSRYFRDVLHPFTIQPNIYGVNSYIDDSLYSRCYMVLRCCSNEYAGKSSFPAISNTALLAHASRPVSTLCLTAVLTERRLYAPSAEVNQLFASAVALKQSDPKPISAALMDTVLGPQSAYGTPSNGPMCVFQALNRVITVFYRALVE